MIRVAGGVEMFAKNRREESVRCLPFVTAVLNLDDDSLATLAFNIPEGVGYLFITPDLSAGRLSFRSGERNVLKSVPRPVLAVSTKNFTPCRHQNKESGPR